MNRVGFRIGGGGVECFVDQNGDLVRVKYADGSERHLSHLHIGPRRFPDLPRSEVRRRDGEDRRNLSQITPSAGVDVKDD